MNLSCRKEFIFTISVVTYILSTVHCNVLSRRERSITVSKNNQTTDYVVLLRGRDGCDGLPGRDGRDGAQGLKGEPGEMGKTGPRGPPGPVSGGVIYTRWGKSSCPNIAGTEMLYSGIAGGTHFTHEGGGGNYLCMPKDPDYALPSVPGVRGQAYIYGGQYDIPIQGHIYHNVPCAVCDVSTRVKLVMIPGKASCPTSWTREYRGYIMTTYHAGGRGRGTFTCVDEDQESLPGSASRDPLSFWFHHVEAGCSGMPCPPYDPTKELNCVICTK